MARITKSPSSPAAAGKPTAPASRNVTDGEAVFEEELPQVGRRGRTKDPLPTVTPQAAYWLVFAPDRWGVVEGRVVPLLYRLVLAHGANGVDGGPDKAPDPSAAFQMIEAKGHTVIPWDIDGRSYLRSYVVGEGIDAKTKAPIRIKSWHTRWETLYPGSEAIQSDTAGYADWLVKLIADGHLPQPRPYILARLQSQYAGHCASSAKKWGDDSDQARRYRRDLEAIRAKIDELADPDAPPAEPADDNPAAELGA